MAQLNIAHITDITIDANREFSAIARNIAAKEVHGLEESEVQPDSVSVLVMPIDKQASLSGADTEVQVLVSGNDWPSDAEGRPVSAKEAKIHFDKMAEKIHASLAKKTDREVYVWVTPFTASGWAE